MIENLKNMKKNEMNLITYILLYLIMEFIVGFVYFENYAMYTMEDKTFRLTFLVLIIIIPNLNLLLTWKSDRNLFSLFSSLLMPIFLFETIFTFSYEKSWTKCIVIFGLIITILVVIIRVLNNRKFQKNSPDNQKDFNHSLYKTIWTLLFSVFTITFFYDRYLYKTDKFFLCRYYNYFNIESVEEESLYEESLNTNIDTISILGSTNWQNLSVKEKSDVLSVAFEIECYSLGMTTDLPAIEVDYADDEYSIVYVNADNKIYISYYNYLNDKDGYSVLKQMIEEVYHCYQWRLIKLCESVSAEEKFKEYANLSIFSSALEYKNEYEALQYIDETNPYEISEYVENNTDLVRNDSHEYAKDRMEEYYEMIENHLNEDNVNN